jgi:putative aminopeptidase FrvX
VTSGKILEILRPLLLTHSPSGHEDEATEWIRDWMARHAKKVWMDAAGNVIAHVAGSGSGPAVALVAHKDEIGFIVKRIEPDGCIRVAKLGGSYPWKYGEGPVDLLGDGEPTPGFLCFGSVHVSEESRDIWAARGSSPLRWEMCWIDTKLSPARLQARGIRPGVKGVVARSRKMLTEIGSYIGAFALDDRALMAVLLTVLERIALAPAPRDVYFIASAGEEIGSGRAAYAAGELPVETLVALEVAPVMPEYDIVASQSPVIIYKDEYNVYDESVCRELEDAVMGAGLSAQHAVLSSFGSDLSFGARSGRFGRYGCIAIPCENTHGYEITRTEALPALARSLEGWLRR